MKTFAPNNGRFKILTDDGFSDFVGVTKTKSENKQGHKIIKLYYDSNFYIKTTPDHKIFFEEFSAKEAYKFKTYDYDYNCDNYADEFYAYDDYYNCENYKTENASAYRRETDDNSPIMLISALMLLVATLLLLSVVAIII